MNSEGGHSWQHLTQGIINMDKDVLGGGRAREIPLSAHNTSQMEYQSCVTCEKLISLMMYL